MAICNAELPPLGNGYFNKYGGGDYEAGDGKHEDVRDENDDGGYNGELACVFLLNMNVKLD